MIETLFAADFALLLGLLLGVAWSVVRPDRRIWPPPGRNRKPCLKVKSGKISVSKLADPQDADTQGHDAQ